MDDSFHERLAEAMQRKGVTLAQVGDVFGITPQAVHDWIKGNTKPRTARLRELAAFLGVNEAWLAWGSTSEAQPDPAYAQQRPYRIFGKKSARAVPLVDWGDIKSLTDLHDHLVNYGKKENDLYVWAHFGASHAAFALIMQDKSMDPEIRSGDIVIIDPELIWEPGFFALAYIKTLDITVLRQFSFDGAEHFLLNPINPHHRPYRFLIDDLSEDVEMLGVASETIRPQPPYGGPGSIK